MRWFSSSPASRVAAQAVSIPPEYRTEVLKKYAEMDDTMATGRLWGVTRVPRQSAQFPANETVLEGGDGHGGKPAVPAGSIGGAGHDDAAGLHPIGPPRNSA